MMRQFLLPILLLLSASAAAGGDPAIITPLTDCPSVRPACMVFHIYLTTPEVNGEGHAPYTKVISMDPDRYDLPIIADVLGRLNGGPETIHRIAFRNRQGALYCQDSSAATVAAGKNGQGTILTDQGELEITDPSVRVGTRKSLAVIDRKTLKETRHATPQWQSHFFLDQLAMARGGRAYWRERNACLDIDGGPRFKQVPATHCRGAKLEPADARTVETVRGTGRYDGEHKKESCLSGYHPHPLYVVCLLGLQARAGAGALRRRSG